MELDGLNLDRFLRRDPNQAAQTKDPIYTASNPAPKRGDDAFRKVGRPKGSEEDDGAPNILTGTVIVSCFIQTSALPSRIEMQGNDLTFFDDTTEQGGQVSGDTSRLIFTHASGKSGEKITQGFIWEKRASTHDSYDNVLSLYALPPKEGRMNYLFWGFSGDGSEFNTNAFQVAVNHDDDATTQPSGNGLFAVGGAHNGTFTGVLNLAVVWNSIVGIPGDGFTTYLAGQGAGFVAIGSDVIPAVAGIDFGDPVQKFGTFYGSVSACPLPTVEDALEIVRRIPEPSFVGERGHYGTDRKYFDDLTFPEEVLYTDAKGRVDIEHNHLLGFLMKAVVELTAKVDYLEGRLPSV